MSLTTIVCLIIAIVSALIVLVLWYAGIAKQNLENSKIARSVMSLFIGKKKDRVKGRFSFLGILRIVFIVISALFTFLFFYNLN